MLAFIVNATDVVPMFPTTVNIFPVGIVTPPLAVINPVEVNVFVFVVAVEALPSVKVLTSMTVVVPAAPKKQN